MIAAERWQHCESMSVRAGSLSDEERTIVRAELDRMVLELGTQGAVARLLGVTQQTVSQAIREGKAGFGLGRRIAVARGYEFDEFIRARAAVSAKTRGEINPPALRSVADRLRYALENRGAVTADIDARLGQSTGYVRRLAASIRDDCDPDLLKRLAEAIGVSFFWLFDGSAPMLRAEPGGEENSTGLAAALSRSVEHVRAKLERTLLEQAIDDIGPALPGHVADAARERFKGQENDRPRKDWITILQMLASHPSARAEKPPGPANETTRPKPVPRSKHKAG